MLPHDFTIFNPICEQSELWQKKDACKVKQGSGFKWAEGSISLRLSVFFARLFPFDSSFCFLIQAMLTLSREIANNGI